MAKTSSQIKIRILGSASGFPVANKHSSAYLLNWNGYHILIDAGDGVSSQLQKYQINVKTIDAVIITHTHPDHAAGLFLLLQWMYLEKRVNKLRIYLPEKLIKKFENMLSCFYIIPDIWPFDWEFLPIVPGTFFKQAGLQIKAYPNTHLSTYKPFVDQYDLCFDAFSLWFGYENEKGIIYTSDVKNFIHLKQAGMHSKILLTECTHVTLDEINQFTKDNQISGIFLTHIPTEMDKDASKNLKYPDFKWVQDGTIIEV